MTRTVSQPQRFVTVRNFAFGVTAVAGLTVLFYANPAADSRFPACPLHYFTGLHCPGCGTLRAIHCLVHGHLLAALQSAHAALATPACLAAAGTRLTLRLDAGQSADFRSGKNHPCHAVDRRGILCFTQSTAVPIQSPGTVLTSLLSMLLSSALYE